MRVVTARQDLQKTAQQCVHTCLHLFRCSVRSVPLATGLYCLGDLKKQAGERIFSVVSDFLVQDDDSSELGRTFEVLT